MDIGGIGEWLVKNVELRAGKTALIFRDVRYTYQELNERVNRIVFVLMTRGVRSGDRVAAILYNSPEFLEVLFACAKIGAIFVPINYRLSSEEAKYIINDAGCHVVIYHSSFASMIAPIRQSTELLHGICLHFDEEGECLETDEDYAQIMSDAQSREIGAYIRQSDIHLMMYTSGTTGNPKGVLLSHGNTIWNAINLMLHEFAIKSDDIVLTVAPMFHIGGLGLHTLPCLYKGSTVVLAPKFEPSSVLSLIERERVSALFLVPSMWFALMQTPNFDKYNLSSLKTLLSGGAPCPIQVIEFFQARGFQFIEGFGMTETAPIAMILSSEDAVRKHGSVGKPVTHVKVRVIDEMERDVPIGTVGELVLQGPNIYCGYWNNAKATEKSFVGGWFHTGDLIKSDEEGFYYLVDRKKDMLISGGENVYPIEIEQVLHRHPSILEVAVVGLKDEKWGEIALAVVVPRNPTEQLGIREVEEFCQDKLAKFKIPKRIEILSELPRNATGKVLKRVLRERYSK